MDFQIFLWFNHLAGRSATGDKLIVFLGEYLLYFIVVGFVVWWFLGTDRMKTRKALVLAFISFVFSREVFTEFIRYIYHRPRPFLSHPGVVELINKGNEASFPSGHAAALFAITFALFYYNRKMGWWMLILSLIVSAARVVAGVHYPTDILGGAALGLLTAWLTQACLGVKIDPWVNRFSSWSDSLLPFTKR